MQATLSSLRRLRGSSADGGPARVAQRATTPRCRQLSAVKAQRHGLQRRCLRLGLRLRRHFATISFDSGSTSDVGAFTSLRVRGLKVSRSLLLSDKSSGGNSTVGALKRGVLAAIKCQQKPACRSLSQATERLCTSHSASNCSCVLKVVLECVDLQVDPPCEEGRCCQMSNLSFRADSNTSCHLRKQRAVVGCRKSAVHANDAKLSNSQQHGQDVSLQAPRGMLDYANGQQLRVSAHLEQCIRLDHVSFSSRLSNV